VFDLTINLRPTLTKKAMKKSFTMFLAAAAVCLGSAAYAQKPTAGSVTTEVNLNLTTGNTTDLIGGGLSFRYFLNETGALTLGFGILSDKSEETFTENPDGTGSTGTQTISTSTIVFRPGYQKHFAGSDKVSPYIGVELPIALNSEKEEWSNFDGTAYADGISAEVTGGSTSFCLNLVGGADYWFTDGMYVGVQVAWGYSSTKQKDTEVTFDGDTTTTPGGKSGGLSAGTTGGLRFGFKF
jgi:hypothetical protein